MQFIIRAWLKIKLSVESPRLLIDSMNQNRANSYNVCGAPYETMYLSKEARENICKRY